MTMTMFRLSTQTGMSNMEFREYSCPHCGELMQVPVGRDKIKCMFCGRDIAVFIPGSGADGATPGASAEAAGAAFDRDHYYEILVSSIDRIIEARERYFDRFTKKHYEGAFSEFNTEFGRELDAIDTLALFSESGVKEAAELLDEFPVLFAKRAAELVLNPPKKRDKTFANEKANIYMVSFLLPAIMGSDKDRQRRVEGFLNAICSEWKASFPMGGIRPAPYDDIAKGFKNGIFGLFKGKF